MSHLKNIDHRFRSRLWSGVVGFPIACLLLSATALALPADVRLSQLYHTGWTARDGAPTGIESMVQTRDGYLWLGNSAGLFRFDGVRFERIEGARDTRLASNNVYSLWAPQDGGLWIGYRFGGASFMKDGKIVNYGLAEGLPAGTVWGPRSAATSAAVLLFYPDVADVPMAKKLQKKTGGLYASPSDD